MSKKHFIALADAVRATEKMIDNGMFSRQETKVIYRRMLADFCSDQNSRFDHHRWMGYIDGANGPNGGKV
jgi:hypothetical protein